MRLSGVLYSQDPEGKHFMKTMSVVSLMFVGVVCAPVVAPGDQPSVNLDNPGITVHNTDNLRVAAVSDLDRGDVFSPIVARNALPATDSARLVLPPSGYAAPEEQRLLALSVPAVAGYTADATAPALATDAAPSAWSDMTAVFRPSRWADPFRPGGPLSFLNLECWFTVPGRTSLTFLGTAVVAGGVVALTSGNDKDDSSTTTTTTTTPSGSGSSGSKNKPDNSDSSSDSGTSGGSGGSGGSSGDGGGGFTEEEG
jgi:uncharacterized membrane protein YgcG